MKKCVRCQLNFQTWYLYKDHIDLNGCIKIIKPERLTNRIKAQIVNDAERTWLAKALIDGTKRINYPSDQEYINLLKELTLGLKAQKGSL